MNGGGSRDVLSAQTVGIALRREPGLLKPDRRGTDIQQDTRAFVVAKAQ